MNKWLQSFWMRGMDCFTGINILTLPYLRFKRSEGFCWNVGNMIIVGKSTLKISKVRKEAAEKIVLHECVR